MAIQEPRLIQVKIECIELPPANWDGHSEIWLGVQRGKAVEQEVRLPIDSATLDVELRLADGPVLNFLGPYAHGTPQDRFLYLCWGHRHLGMWVGFRRAKIPLSGLTAELLESGAVRLQVRCTDKKGGPACATLKGDFVSWSPILP